MDGPRGLKAIGLIFIEDFVAKVVLSSEEGFIFLTSSFF